MELLTVLVIVGVLVMVGVSRLGSRPSGAVRSLMDEMEGTLAAAHKRSVASGKDVIVAVQGAWTKSDPFLLAYGDATDQSRVAVSSSTILANGLTSPEAFHYQPTSRDCLHAGVAVAGSGWWSTAITGNTALSSVAPFQASVSSLASAVVYNAFQAIDPASDACNLCSLGSVRISGVSKRFTSSFCIAIVGLRDGQPIVGGPMGLIVVLDNGATIYKFFNQGASEGNDAWKKL